MAAGVTLLRTCLGFRPMDAIPGWLVLDTTERGGVTLAAERGGELVGFSYAVPALAPDGPFLLSCGLAVRPVARSRGIGRRLKHAQRKAALDRGLTVIRWTADPLASSALRLYLSGLGARLVGYHARRYAGLRPEGRMPHDDVEVVWPLCGAGPPRSVGAPRELVEIPFDSRSLGDAEALGWRLRVRTSVVDLLATGQVGTGVVVDRSRRRSWLEFERGDG